MASGANSQNYYVVLYRRRRATAPGAALPLEQLHAAATRYVADWTGTSSDAFEEGLDELEKLTGARLTAGDRYELWDQATLATMQNQNRR